MLCMNVSLYLQCVHTPTHTSVCQSFYFSVAELKKLSGIGKGQEMYFQLSQKNSELERYKMHAPDSSSCSGGSRTEGGDTVGRMWGGSCQNWAC